MALGEGWADDEEIQGISAAWAVAQEAQAFLPASGQTNHRLEVAALPFDYPGAGEQQVTPEINGQRLEAKRLSPGWGTYAWEVPAAILKQGLNDLRFTFDRLDAPAEVLPGNGAIGGTGVQAPVSIEVNSGGPADFAFITLGAETYAVDASDHRPGYNVALVDAESGKLLERRGFDTTPAGSQAEASALAAFIEGASQGTVVAVALQGDGTVHLTGEAVAAFHSIGGQADPRDTAGWSHAIIGVKGAAPGSAMEAAGPDNGWLRAAPDWRTLGVAVDTIQWQQTGP